MSEPTKTKPKGKGKDFSAVLSTFRSSAAQAAAAPFPQMPHSPEAISKAAESGIASQGEGGEMDDAVAIALRVQANGGILNPDAFTTESAKKANRPLVVHKVAQLTVHPNNPRPVSASEDLDELAADMRANGQREPIHIVPYKGGWAIMEGQRRWCAAKIAGITELEAFEHPEMGPLDVYAYGRAIHKLRNDTCAIDDALSCRKLLDEEGITRRDLIARLASIGERDIDEASFSKQLAITSYEPDLIDEIKKAPKRFSFRHLYALAQVRKASHLNRAIEEARRVIFAPEDAQVTAVSLEKLARRLAEGHTKGDAPGRRSSTAKVIHGGGGTDIGVLRANKGGQIQFNPGKAVSLSAEQIDEMHARVARVLMEFFAETSTNAPS